MQKNLRYLRWRYSIKISNMEMIRSLLCWKFRCERWTSLRSTNHWKVRWNHGKKRDKHVSTVEIARELDTDHKTVLNHLYKAEYKKKLDV